MREINLQNVTPLKPKIKSNQEITVYTVGAGNFTTEPEPNKLILRDADGRAKVAEGVENDDVVNVGQLKRYVSDKMSTVYINGGSRYYAELSDLLVEENLNYVWNILDDFTTDDNFTEGANIEVPAGSTVAVVMRDGRIMFDLLGSIYDLNFTVRIERWI